MPTFEYIALDQSGRRTQGSVTAESSAAARAQLRHRHLHPTRLRPVSQVSRTGRWNSSNIFSMRRRRQILDFTRQMSTMIQADVTLTEALAVMINQSSNPHFTQVLQNIRDQVTAGESLADGVKGYPTWFDPIYVSMVRVGEATGNIAKSLSILADYMSKKMRLEAKVKSAMIYPAILVVVCILVTIFLMTIVVPKITDIITKSGRPLPALTIIVKGASDFMVSNWWILLLALGAGYWLFRKALATGKGRMAFDRFVLKIPVIGELIGQSIVARFTSTLAALIRSGMPVAESLQVVADVTGNSIMAHAIRKARERIIAGADIATPLQESKVVGPAVAHMIAVGERSGELESMLLTIADSIEESTDISVQRISSLIEPIIIVVMAVIVGFIVIATMLPILQVADLSKI